MMLLVIYFLLLSSPSRLSTNAEQQMEVHNRILPLRGFLFPCLSLWTFFFFFFAETESFIVTQPAWLTGTGVEFVG